MKTRKHFTFDPSAVKGYHEKLTLNVIRENAIVSSSELIRLTNLNKSTIFSILKELSCKSLIVSTGKGEATEKGGVRPSLWQLNAEAYYAIGIDVEIGEMTAVILDLTGKTIKKNIYKVDVSNNLDELVESIIFVINSIISDSGIDEGKILGCCIAFTGIVDYLRGIVVMSGVLFNLNLQLLDKLKHRFRFPILIENNANAAAIGEKWIGEGKNKNNFMVLLIEFDISVAGLGIGIILEGNIYRGASFSAGELYPHMPNLRQMIDMVRPRFPEGKILKDYVSSPEELDVKNLIEMARQGDEIALLIFKMFGGKVGEIIAPSIALLNPDTLIITGTISELGQIIINPIENAIQMNVLAVTSNTLKIAAGKNQQFSVAVGAASLVLSNFFKLPMSNY
ncbi:MAG: ROK family protein [Ignavibacteria bacterium]|jgi:predicted NBD/HSP70 family sugar kinase|nr:ROK family protein [Ignavibacteria bacterium]MCU7502858.1 ROK family protein [Ignavibacteria bacterium]MCU7515648.1 ROK family protein [Ignavibacteria bacterium]